MSAETTMSFSDTPRSPDKPAALQAGQRRYAQKLTGTLTQSVHTIPVSGTIPCDIVPLATHPCAAVDVYVALVWLTHPPVASTLAIMSAVTLIAQSCSRSPVLISKSRLEDMGSGCMLCLFSKSRLEDMGSDCMLCLFISLSYSNAPVVFRLTVSLA